MGNPGLDIREFMGNIVLVYMGNLVLCLSDYWEPDYGSQTIYDEPGSESQRI